MTNLCSSSNSTKVRRSIEETILYSIAIVTNACRGDNVERVLMYFTEHVSLTPEKRKHLTI